MGLDYHTAVGISDLLSSPLAEWLPKGVRRAALDAGFELGRAAAPALGTLRRREIEAVLESGESLRLQYPREDLGFIYAGDQAAVLRRPADKLAADRASLPRPRHEPYEPQAIVGGRLPHAAVRSVRAAGWLDPAVPLQSTIDLPSVAQVEARAGLPPRLVLVLLPGADGRGIEPWVHAAEGMPSETPVRVVLMESTESSTDATVEKDALVIQVDSSTAPWMAGATALLVRPDGHISARWDAAVHDKEEAVRELTSAVRASTGRS